MGGLTLLLAGCQQTGPLSDADKQGLRNDMSQWVKDANAGDWAKVASLYASDAVFMPPNEAAVNGRDKIQAWMTAFPKLQKIELSVQQIEGHGDLAYIRGTYDLTLAPQGTTPAISDKGKFLEVHKKQPDGKWATVSDMFNSDLPAAPPPQPAKAQAPAGKAATEKTAPKR
jgi:uncharacterized protein (TIGR02246 family)